MVYARNPFGLTSDTRGEELQSPGMLPMYSSDGISYIERSAVSKNANDIDKWKVYIGKLNPDRGGVNNASDGKMNVITKIHILRPSEVITDTYLLLGVFETENEAIKYQEFFKCKLVRYLVSLALTSMNISKETFQFVPIPNLDKIWTDEDLNKEYDISDTESTYIDNIIRTME
jgi:site-specific DNA-methyltransferase (adenine-specific)